MTPEPVTSDFDTDIVIIGSGFGGSVAARACPRRATASPFSRRAGGGAGDLPPPTGNPRRLLVPRLGCHGTWGFGSSGRYW